MCCLTTSCSMVSFPTQTHRKEAFYILACILKETFQVYTHLRLLMALRHGRSYLMWARLTFCILFCAIRRKYMMKQWDAVRWSEHILLLDDCRSMLHTGHNVFYVMPITFACPGQTTCFLHGFHSTSIWNWTWLISTNCLVIRLWRVMLTCHQRGRRKRCVNQSSKHLHHAWLETVPLLIVPTESVSSCKVRLPLRITSSWTLWD